MVSYRHWPTVIFLRTAFLWLLIPLFMFLPVKPLAATYSIQSNSSDSSLPVVVIKEIMRRAGHQAVHLYEGRNDISQNRVFSDVENGELDIIWVMTNRTMEDRFMPVRIPIYRGILGMRLPLVRRDKISSLSQINSITDLRQFTAGQGKTWADTLILEANRIPVAKTLKYPNLFYMLEGGRFDYYPRGLYEPWSEIERFKELDLAVSPDILIRYKSPLYFFTSKQNRQLNGLINSVFDEMIADGSFNTLFFADPQVNEGLTKSNLEQRVIIDLDNPNLSAATPLDREELWFDPISGK